MSPDHQRNLEIVAQELRRRGRAPRSIAVVHSALRGLCRFLGERSLEQVQPKDVRRYLARREAEGIATTTQTNLLYHLRAAFRTLVAREVLATDPTAELSVKQGEPALRRLLSLDEVERLLVASGQCPPDARPLQCALALRDRACLELLYGLGLRASEVRAAEVLDLNLTEATLLVRRAKRGKPRLLPLPPGAVPHLRAYLTDARAALAGGRGRDQGRLLLTRRGRLLHVSGVAEIVARAAGRAGVTNTHPHAFRRALASHLVEAGVNVKVVQTLLGHADLATTSLYVGVDRRALRRAVETLERER